MRKNAFTAFADENTERLMVGTFPGVKSLEKSEYYGNKQNHFWKLLYEVFEAPFEQDYERRLDFLKANGIGLWDVFESCEREGSLDSAIRNAVANDFESLFQAYPRIRTLYFTSKQAYLWFYKIYKDSLNVELVVLASPSPANARMTYEQKLFDWKEKLGGELGK